MFFPDILYGAGLQAASVVACIIALPFDLNNALGSVKGQLQIVIYWKQ